MKELSLNLKSTDKDILSIPSTLTTSEYPFNTLALFYYLWRQHPGLSRLLLSVFIIRRTNKVKNYFAVAKNSQEKPLPKIAIGVIVKNISSLLEETTR